LPPTALRCLLMSCRDPGDWATGLAGGAQFGYSLLLVFVPLSHSLSYLLPCVAC
jgi:Mn2+/Fe2+ NRAMP family transporter